MCDLEVCKKPQAELALMKVAVSDGLWHGKGSSGTSAFCPQLRGEGRREKLREGQRVVETHVAGEPVRPIH